MRRPHQLEMLLWALINNAYPAVAAKCQQRVPLSLVRQVMTASQADYRLHMEMNAPYREFITAMWEEIANELGAEELYRRTVKINRRLKLKIGLAVEVPPLWFSPDDQSILRPLGIAADNPADGP